MDVWGVTGVEAEAELLSAVVTCFRRLRLTAEDVGLKVIPSPPPLCDAIATHAHCYCFHVTCSV